MGDLQAVPKLDEVASNPALARGLSAATLVVLAARCAVAQTAIANAQAALLLNVDSTTQNTTSDQDDTLLTIAQTAAILAVPKAWLYRRAKRLGAVKLGSGTLRFSRAAIQDYMRASKLKATPSRRKGMA